MEDFYLEIEVGDVYPGWEKSFEGSIMSIINGEIQLLVSFPYPREIDIDDFNKLSAYGIYSEKYPLVIWQFGENFLLPAPYNPEYEMQFRADDLGKFFSQQNKNMTRILIDQNGIIRILKQEKLRSKFIDELQRVWHISNTDWTNYNPWLIKIFKQNTYNLWEKARKHKHIIN